MRLWCITGFLCLIPCLSLSYFSVKKYQEKLDEIKLLTEDLKRAEEGHEVLNEEKGCVKEEQRRLYRSLSDSEKYIQKLEEEMEIRKTNEEFLKQKVSFYLKKCSSINFFNLHGLVILYLWHILQLSVAEETSGELSALINVIREELTNLKQQVNFKSMVVFLFGIQNVCSIFLLQF